MTYLKTKKKTEKQKLVNVRCSITILVNMGEVIFRDFTPQCCRSRIDCCRNFAVEPMVISGSMVGNRGTKMFGPNWDDRDDLYACTIRPHQRPISLRQIPTM